MTVGIGNLGMGKEEFGFQVFQRALVQRKLPLEQAVRDPFPLAHEVHHLIEHLIQIHVAPSLWPVVSSCARGLSYHSIFREE
jgi:hypothetical protein